MFQIPNTNRQFIQANNSDVIPNLWGTFNVDLVENEGRLRVGKRLILNTNTLDIPELTRYPAGFRYFNNGSDSSFYCIAGNGNQGGINVGEVFKASAIDGSWAKVTTSGSPAGIDSETSDIETAFGEMYVTSAIDAKVYYLNSSNVWNNFSAGSAGDVMMMTYYNGRMYCTKAGNQVISWDSSHTVANSGSYTLTFDVNTRITWLRSSSNRIWIGTVNTQGGKGYIYEWDGTTVNTPTKAYRLEAGGALACVIKDDVPYVIDTNANLLYWQGGTFKKLTGFNRKKNKLLFNPFYKTNQRFIHPNGMAIIRGKINILIDGTNFDVSSHNGTQEETIPSGIYEFDETRGLTHKYSFGLSKAGGTIIDYGQIRIFGAGAISEILTAQSPITTNGTFLCGASYYVDASTVYGGIFYEDSNDTLKKIGTIMSSKIDADDATPYHLPSVENDWLSLYTLYKPFFDTADKIVPKYRTSDVDFVEATITWVSPTKFTVPNSSVNISNYWTAGTGGEVEVVQGLGSGKCSHIINAVNDVGVWTVTVDETYTNATGTSKARFQNWKKISSIVYNNQNFNSDTIGIKSTWIQFKVMMLFSGKDEVERFIITNSNINPAT